MTAETMQSTQPPVIDALEVYRVLGSMEAGQKQNQEQIALFMQNQVEMQRILGRLKQGQTQSREQMAQIGNQIVEVNRRIDRLLYTIIGISAVAVAGYVLQQVFGG